MTSFSDEIIETITIDCLIFGFEEGDLQVLLVKHSKGTGKGRWALPGGWIKYNEGLDNAASRVLSVLTGVKDIYLEQLRAFGELDRYALKRVLTVAFYSLVRPKEYKLIPGFTASDVRWFKINRIPDLPYDHNKIVDFGFNFLKHKVRHEPIGFNLLPEKFTLLQLQELYESILDIKLDKPNFRRKFMNMNLLVPCNEKQKYVAHRAANLFKFDKMVYDQLTEKGFTFEF